ncbi:hypothetical protein GGS23DRAFT_560560 [Durotheca rogersii]|uniref:uncharacterized protein n=1 Tax=Durotheca rogersii TaxID=419775 RepID=UPI00221F5577|nr:uncharacterized protein GGS23DRAFT_560560 [Durotheca rogersii]KAI5864517.1 hypothetical protein GGS23DRAFT_560560 [Durotheca rogersii]
MCGTCRSSFMRFALSGSLPLSLGEGRGGTPFRSSVYTGTPFTLASVRAVHPSTPTPAPVALGWLVTVVVVVVDQWRRRDDEEQGGGRERRGGVAVDPARERERAGLGHQGRGSARGAYSPLPPACVCAYRGVGGRSVGRQPASSVMLCKRPSSSAEREARTRTRTLGRWIDGMAMGLDGWTGGRGGMGGPQTR